MSLQIVLQAETRGRLDRVIPELIAQQHPETQLTRSQLKVLIDSGQVTVDGVVIFKAGSIVQGPGVVEVKLKRVPSGLLPESIPLEVLYEDAVLLVINKPAGLTVHPGAGRQTGTLANAVMSRMEKEMQQGARPGIVHRLDKDTSGVLVIAKTAQAHAALAEQFAQKTTERLYQALVLCTPRSRRAVMTAEKGTISSTLIRDPKNRLRFATRAVDSGHGKRAVTHWEVIERCGYAALVGVRLETGRTHQIRAHFDSIACPVIGDPVYGDFSALPKPLAVVARHFGRQALHAATLGFNHPTSGERLSFSAPLPADMQSILERFRTYGSG